ncbi:tetratricopeptide repeat protein [Aerophototrophica crusticola]|uniref:Tetratricopeptide repeat protein n=1 Tax=Aerophototrophica crusticola TaxID=1709002 RepID=A0A858R6J7_9PROT|nr:tetratricopeptide repeat protein [Rhodospirillaceae bacterium B3]
MPVVGVPVGEGVEAALAAAQEALYRDDRTAALAHARAALDLDAGVGEAHALLAELLADQADGTAVAHARAAVAAEPGRLEWQRLLAEALASDGQVAEARAVAAAALDRRPDDAALHRLLARLLLAVGERDGALSHAREARFLAPRDLSGLASLGHVWREAGEPLLAAEVLEPALRQAHPMDPARAAAGVALARAWIELAEPRKARDVLEAALEADPADTAGAKVLLDGIDGSGGELTPAFVRALFDQYADRFDQHLVGKLGYGVPGKLREALGRLGLVDGAGLRVLDAGCGTGLMGVEARGLAGTLAGFDLSPRMVEKARARGIYDRLWVGELVEAFRAEPGAWDLLLAADVLVYLGDLDPVMRAAAAALVPGGRFAFSVERAADGFVLQESRRYAHSEAHVRAAAEAAGLEVEMLEPLVPRLDRGKPLDGLLVVLRRRSAPSSARPDISG